MFPQQRLEVVLATPVGQKKEQLLPTAPSPAIQ